MNEALLERINVHSRLIVREICRDQRAAIWPSRKYFFRCIMIKIMNEIVQIAFPRFARALRVTHDPRRDYFILATISSFLLLRPVLLPR